MFGINKIALFILLGVNVTWQIQHIIPCLIFHLLGDPGPFGLPLEFSLSYNCSFTRTCWLGFAFLLPTSSAVLGDWLALSTAESILFFTVSVPSGYFHHSGQRHIPCLTEFQVKFSIPNA